MCSEKDVLVKNVYKWAKLFKEGRNSIQDKDRPGKPIKVSTTEMVDSINVLTSVDRKHIIEDISEQL